MRYRHYLNIDPEFDVEVVTRFQFEDVEYVVIGRANTLPSMLTADEFSARWDGVMS